MSRRILTVVLVAVGLFFLAAMPVKAADPEIDRLLQSPVGKDWVTNGGNLTNQRYSLQKQIDTTNVKQLKGAWMTRPQRLRARRQIFVRGDAARQRRDHVYQYRQRRCLCARRQDRSDPMGALVSNQSADLDGVLWLAQPRIGDG